MWTQQILDITQTLALATRTLRMLQIQVITKVNNKNLSSNLVIVIPDTLNQSLQDWPQSLKPDQTDLSSSLRSTDSMAKCVYDQRIFDKNHKVEGQRKPDSITEQDYFNQMRQWHQKVRTDCTV